MGEYITQYSLLSEFGEFLRIKLEIPEKYVPYYISWVDRFLSFSNDEDLSEDVKIEKFKNYLCSQRNLADWQIEQGQTAVKVYVKEFLNRIKLDGDKRDKLVNDLRRAIRVKHYAYRTEQSYIDWVKRFYEYMVNVKKKDFTTAGLSSLDVRDYLTFLAVIKKVSASTQNQAFNALLFLAREVLGVTLEDLNKTIRAKRGQKLPVVLSVEEVKGLFEQVSGKNLLILQLLYGAGLRLMELVRLRVQDIDFSANLIFVRAGKQDKDRTTILPEYIKKELEAYLKDIKCLHNKDLANGYGEVYLPEALARKYQTAPKEWKWQYVFPAANLSVDPRGGKIRRHHISPSAVQKIVKAASVKMGIYKRVSVHTLRHSFATHLLMDRVNIREIQELLGHKSVETTMIYTHVVRNMENIPQSPLDKLYKDRLVYLCGNGPSKIGEKIC